MTKNFQCVTLLGASGLMAACGSRTDLSELRLTSARGDVRSRESEPDRVPTPPEPGDGVPSPTPTEPAPPPNPPATPPAPRPEPPELPEAWGAFVVTGPCVPLTTVTVPNSLSDDGRYYIYAERTYNPDRTKVLLFDRHNPEAPTTILHEVDGDDQQRPIISGNAELLAWKEGLGNGSQLQLVDRVSQSPVYRTPLGDGYRGVFSGDARYLAYSTRDQDITVPYSESGRAPAARIAPAWRSLSTTSARLGGRQLGRMPTTPGQNRPQSCVWRPLGPTKAL